MGKKSRVQSPTPARVFMFDFLYSQYCCCCVFTFLSKNKLFIGIYFNSFYNVNLFSILNVLQDLWPIIRVKIYRPSIFNRYWFQQIICILMRVVWQVLRHYCFRLRHDINILNTQMTENHTLTLSPDMRYVS